MYENENTLYYVSHSQDLRKICICVLFVAVVAEQVHHLLHYLEDACLIIVKIKDKKYIWQ